MQVSRELSQACDNLGGLGAQGAQAVGIQVRQAAL